MGEDKGSIEKNVRLYIITIKIFHINKDQVEEVALRDGLP